MVATGLIFEVKHLAVHDGDGIRTTVFFKGCPLKCVWCHNPEGISFQPQLSFVKHKCIGCGECTKTCKSGAHVIEAGQHVFLREKCIGCGQCEGTCLGDALKLYGKRMTVGELLTILLEDKEFYDTSGGGVTLSGGECLMQADFCAELLKELKKNHIHTALDTCGFAPKDAIDKVLPYTDVFLFDLKAIDADVHAACTGQSNDLILDNLQYIDQSGKPIEIRIPYVPGFNDKQMKKIASHLKNLNNLTKVRVLPYHNYAGSKYEALGIENTLPAKMPSKEETTMAEKLMMQWRQDNET